MLQIACLRYNEKCFGAESDIRFRSSFTVFNYPFQEYSLSEAQRTKSQLAYSKITKKLFLKFQMTYLKQIQGPWLQISNEA